jgi:hypothetical protein
MNRLVVAAATVAALILPSSVVAGGRGDSYLRPINVTSSTNYVSVQHNTRSRTLQDGEPTPSCQGNFARSLWYTFTPDASLFYIIETLESDFDTVVAVYTYNGSTFTPVACDDDTGNSHAGNGNTSWLDVSLDSNFTYYIQVGGYSDAYGRLVFKIYPD